ncbi:MAG: asparaginase, partial [Actinomycetales bacterium]
MQTLWSSPTINPADTANGRPPAVPAHVPLVVQTRGGVAESVHYGSLVALGADGSTALAAGDPHGRIYPRSALKPLQAVAMVRAGLRLPPQQLALAAASHSGADMHQQTARDILASAGLDESALANTPDLPYGTAEREAWLRAGGASTRLAQNCSGKHAAMVATCALNGWPVVGYLDPAHPLPALIRSVVEELTGQHITVTSTDGCGTEVFALSLHAMATAFSRIATAGPGTAEHAVAAAMSTHPEFVA